MTRADREPDTARAGGEPSTARADGEPSVALADWEAVIGIEVHVQLSTRTKLFCGCSTRFGAPPNTQTCPVCLGLPGALPVPNGRAVELAVTLGLAVGAEVRARSVFARKNYFYPDLPKGYQITQYEHPICEGGRLAYERDDGSVHEVRLVRAHLEEDAGKTVHEADRSLVDLNRAGVPLLEIVTAPELRSPAEAAACLRQLRAVVRHLGISDGNMEEGSLRCDANVSVRRRGEARLGVRTEIKNLNSFRFVERALAYEIERQAAVLEAGGTVVQETRLYDPDRDETRVLRSKEEAHDYRYFPDPDLPPLVVPEELTGRLRADLPALPLARAARYREALGLTAEDARVLTAERELAEWFEAALAAYDGEPKKVANWMQTEVLRALKSRPGGLSALALTPERLAALLRLVDRGAVSGSAAKRVLERLLDEDVEPEVVIERQGLARLSDPAALAAVVDQVLAERPEEAAQYRAGRTGLLGWLVGEVMKRTRGRADPKLARALLEERLGR